MHIVCQVIQIWGKNDIVYGMDQMVSRKLIELMRKTLGSYYACVPVSLITQKRTMAEQASPQIHKTINKRLIVFSETNRGRLFKLRNNKGINRRRFDISKRIT